MHHSTRGGQRTAYRRQFFPCTVWVLAPSPCSKLPFPLSHLMLNPVSSWVEPAWGVAIFACRRGNVGSSGTELSTHKGSRAGPVLHTLSEPHPYLAHRWSAILSAPSGPKLLFDQLGLCPGHHQLHICQNNMSGFFITQGYRQTDFQKVQV